MFRIITVPFDESSGTFDESALSDFLINKRLLNYRAEFFSQNSKPFWTVFLEYDPLIEPPAEKETAGLDEPQRVLLEKLKAWRKQRAEKDGVPVYIVGTNREFRDIVTARPESIEALKSVKGFGKAKIGKYGQDIVAMIRAFYEKTG